MQKYVTTYRNTNAIRLLFALIAGLLIGYESNTRESVFRTPGIAMHMIPVFNTSGIAMRKVPVFSPMKTLSDNPDILEVDRSQPLDPEELFGSGTTFEDEDQDALKLTEVHINKIALDTALKSGENGLNGEVRLQRLKATGKVRLDLMTLITFFMHQEYIPREWKTLTYGGKAAIFFDGTIVKSRGIRFGIGMYWDSDKDVWVLAALSLTDNRWGKISPSALYPK